MDLGEIVVSESPAERNLYAEKQPRSQDVLGRSGKQIHQVFKYLTGEMKEYGEWMKSKHGDMLGLSGMARWEHLHHQQEIKCWATRQGTTSPSETEQRRHGLNSL